MLELNVVVFFYLTKFSYEFTLLALFLCLKFMKRTIHSCLQLHQMTGQPEQICFFTLVLWLWPPLGI